MVAFIRDSVGPGNVCFPAFSLHICRNKNRIMADKKPQITPIDIKPDPIENKAKKGVDGNDKMIHESIAHGFFVKRLYHNESEKVITNEQAETITKKEITEIMIAKSSKLNSSFAYSLAKYIKINKALTLKDPIGILTKKRLFER